MTQRYPACTFSKEQTIMTTSPLSAPSVPAPSRALLLPGLGLSAALALASIEAGKNAWLLAHGFGALTVAIVLGMLMGNTVFSRMGESYHTGVTFSKQTLLRLGIILYGLRLTFQDIFQVGISGIVIDTCTLASTFALASWLGVKVFKLERSAAMLIGAGSSICGAAAVMATGPVLRARSDEVTVAVSTVVVFGSVAIFLYPVLHSLTWWQGHVDFGVYIGSTVHEVAQVVAAARSIDEHTANTAIITKMVRVMMLAPFLLLLPVFTRNGKDSAGHADSQTKTSLTAGIPWFAFAFIGVVALNSLVSLPTVAVSTLIDADTFLLAMAMAALGLTTQLSSVRRAGMRPLLLGGVLFAWLIIGGGAINAGVTALFQ